MTKANFGTFSSNRFTTAPLIAQRMTDSRNSKNISSTDILQFNLLVLLPLLDEVVGKSTNVECVKNYPEDMTQDGHTSC